MQILSANYYAPVIMMDGVFDNLSGAYVNVSVDTIKSVITQCAGLSTLCGYGYHPVNTIAQPQVSNLNEISDRVNNILWRQRKSVYSYAQYTSIDIQYAGNAGGNLHNGSNTVTCAPVILFQTGTQYVVCADLIIWAQTPLLNLNPFDIEYNQGVAICQITDKYLDYNFTAIENRLKTVSNMSQFVGFFDSVPYTPITYSEFSPGVSVYDGPAITFGGRDVTFTAYLDDDIYYKDVSIIQTETTGGLHPITPTAVVTETDGQVTITFTAPETAGRVIVVRVITTDEPYSDGGGSVPEQGEEDFTDTGEPVDFPDLPQITAIDTGFIKMYNPSTTQLKQLATEMHGTTIIDALKQFFTSPMDAILGLGIIPVNPLTSGAENVKLGVLSMATQMPRVQQQYVRKNFGILNIKEQWGGYLDYSPYTKAGIMLPYLGYNELNIDDIMNKSVEVEYHIDILSGACIAFIKCGNSVLYQFPGSVIAQVPVTNLNYSSMISSVFSAIGAGTTGLAAGGLAAIAGMGALGVVGAGLSLAGAAAQAVSGAKPKFSHAGSLSGAGGLLSIQTPYLVLERPKQSLANGYKDLEGFPANIGGKLGEFKGFTVVESINFSGGFANSEELAELEIALKEGVFL